MNCVVLWRGLGKVGPGPIEVAGGGVTVVHMVADLRELPDPDSEGLNAEIHEKLADLLLKLRKFKIFSAVRITAGGEIERNVDFDITYIKL